MKKKKLLLTLAVLTVPSIVAAGALAGCDKKHDHAYTKWANNETQHWLVCPDDNAKDENSVENHEFGIDGKCDCGYVESHTHAYTKWKSNETQHWKVCPNDNTEDATTRANHNYVNGECECGRQVGSLTGTVKLYKLGEFIEDDLTDVTARLGETPITVGTDGSFNVADLEVGRTYKLTVSKAGYVDYIENFEVEKGVATKAGKDGVVALQYSVFKNQNLSFLDYSGANDGYVTFKSKGKTEDKLVTADKYLNVVAYGRFELTDAYKTTSAENSLYSVGLKFDDGKEVRIDAWFKSDSALVKHPEWRTCFADSELKYGLELHYWDVEKFKSSVADGFDYMLIRNNGKLKLIIEDYVTELDLPEAYASQSARVMLVAEDYGDATGKKVKFAINESEMPESDISLTTNAADFTGAAAALASISYKYGETVTLNVTVPEGKIATVTIDGKSRFVDAADAITFEARFGHTISVNFSNERFTGEVDADAKYNGKTITLTRDGEADVTLTVEDGKVSLNNIKLGVWTATCELFGMRLETEVLLPGNITELDLTGFVSGTADIDFQTGAFNWYRQDHKTVNIGVAEATGDQYVALKINTGLDFLAWANKYDEMHFGIAMAVNGVEHAVNFNWRNWQHDQIGFSSDALTGDADSYDRYRGNTALMTHLFKPKYTGFGNGWDNGTYGGAITEDGLYFVLHYESATGNANIYLSDGETYILVFTEKELFEKNGTLTAFGIVKGDKDDGWAGGSHMSGLDRKFTFTVGYGATMNAAVGDGVSEWKSTVTITSNKEEVDGANVEANKTSYEYGETVTLTITIPAGCSAIVTIDNGTPRVVEETGTVTFTATKSQYAVDVVFASRFSGELTVDEMFNGKKLTLIKEGETPIELTVTNGKVTLTNVKLGEWTATCNLLGTNLKAAVTLVDGMTELDLSGFNAGSADVNLTTGEFQYVSQKYNEPTSMVNVNLEQAKTGDTYVGIKISTDVAYDEWTKNNFEELHLGVWMTVGDNKHWVELHWRNWETAHFAISKDEAHENANASTDVLKNILWKPVDGFHWENNHGWTAMPFGEAFCNDGIYLIMKYESATGNVDVLLAKPDGYVKVCTFDAMFASNGEVKAFGVDALSGDADFNFHKTPNGFKIDSILHIGSSMQDITGSVLEELTCSVELEDNASDITGASATLSKNTCKVGETCVISVTVPNGYKAVVTVDGNAQDLYENGEVPVVVYKNLQIGVEFAKLPYVTKEVNVDPELNGTNIVLKRTGYEDVTLAVTDGKVSLNAVTEGTWVVEFTALGETVKEECFIDENFTEFFTLMGTANINLATGEFTYLSHHEKAPTVNVNLAEAKTGDAYVGLKISTDCTLEDLTHKYEELHLGVWMTVGDSKHWIELHWRNWQARSLGIHTDTNHSDGGSASEALNNLLWKPSFVGDDGGSSYGDGNHNWELNPFGTAFLNDGIYLIMKYEAATGNVDVLLAKSDGYVKVCTFEGMFAANGEVKGFGVGKLGDDWKFHESPNGFNIDCVLSIGSSLQDITGNELGEWTAPATTTPEE